MKKLLILLLLSGCRDCDSSYDSTLGAELFEKCVARENSNIRDCRWAARDMATTVKCKDK